MRNSRVLPIALASACAIATTWAPTALAQQQARGFAVERLYPSAPGGGWFVMDELDMRGGLGGAVSMSGGYAHNPLTVSGGGERVGVVTHQAFLDVGAAVTYDRYRLYLNLTSPMVIRGTGATIGGVTYTAPVVDAGQSPDLVSDARIGYDVRLFGGPRGPFRLGVGAQLIIPNGARSEYDTDETFRAMMRVLFAGTLGRLNYAAHLGWHVRSLDDPSTQGSPRGSELLFGVAAGWRFAVGRDGHIDLIVGPEIFGETALQSFFGPTSTGLEALVTGRLEQTGDDGPQLRLKVGAGAGIDAHFGVPQWRLVLNVELFDHHASQE